jgi:hypothetical protein
MAGECGCCRSCSAHGAEQGQQYYSGLCYCCEAVKVGPWPLSVAASPQLVQPARGLPSKLRDLALQAEDLLAKLCGGVKAVMRQGRVFALAGRPTKGAGRVRVRLAAYMVANNGCRSVATR